MTTVLPDINAPLHDVKGVGQKTEEKLQQLGISSLKDVLFHLPLRYQDKTQLHYISRLRVGAEVLIQGEVVDVQHTGFHRGRRSLLVTVQDKTACITLRFFHFNQSQVQQFKSQTQGLRCFGEVRFSRTGLEMVHPQYYWVDLNNPPPLAEVLTPIYPTVKGLSQRVWHALTTTALDAAAHVDLPTVLPEQVVSDHNWPSLVDALYAIHRPAPGVNLNQLQAATNLNIQRLSAEELLTYQLTLLSQKTQKQQASAFSLPPETTLTSAFLSQLPFALTSAQTRVFQDVSRDLALQHPMMRLLQGDVGSGKTVVAALAFLQAVGAGCQAAFMAPTSLLAEQHVAHVRAWFEPLGLSVVCLTGSATPSMRKKIQAQLSSGEVNIIVGTHALFQADIVFNKLGLIVIDEQHRFGVKQRHALKEKGVACEPHQLIMTATPIPRTLAMLAYADLDVSVIDELPAGRKPIETVLLDNARRPDLLARVAARCLQGEQVYWVCTLIDDSEHVRAEAAEALFVSLKAALPDVKMGLVHGRMKSAEKDAVMQEFSAGNLNILVATTVIEVGVDVPNASLMVVENAERLGLAQLHQLRGRVGRGQKQSFCVLLYQAPLSRIAKDRLHLMQQTHSGFEIAKADLQMRGPGEVFGVRQSGGLRFKIADLARDTAILSLIESESLIANARLDSQQCRDAQALWQTNAVRGV